jgi:hypothetical protein
MKHTELPWSQKHRKRHDGMYATEIFDKKGEAIADLAWYPVDEGNGVTSTNRGANAQYIVKACNSHYDLIKAFKELRKLRPYYQEPPNCFHARQLKIIDDAITKAETI